MDAIADDLKSKHQEFSGLGLNSIVQAIEVALESTFKSFVEKDTGETVEYYRAFKESQANRILATLQTSVNQLGGIVYQEGPDEDVPIPFDGTDLADHLEILAEQEGLSQYLDFLVARMRTFLSDSRMRDIIADTDGLTLENWLDAYIGSDKTEQGCVSVIDLSLVPTAKMLERMLQLLV